MTKDIRQQKIDEIRRLQKRHDDMFINRHPVLAMFGAGLGILILNLIFWGAIIAMIAFAITVVF